MPTNYSRGRAFEYRTRDKLMKLGAAYVMRAAQSKGAVDLLALWPITEYGVLPPWLIQCKFSVNGVGTLSSAERKKLKVLATQVAGLPVLATPGLNGRGVRLVDLYSNKEIQTG